MSSSAIIYIVDDDVSVCRALALLLRSHGFKVETFTRAAGFLAFKHPKVPSCLLLDIRLPDINGLVLQERIKNAYSMWIYLITIIKCYPLDLKCTTLSIMTRLVNQAPAR